MLKISKIFLILLLVSSCSPSEPSAQDIVNKSIEVAGGDRYLDLEIEFEFRDKIYYSRRNNGDFIYERIQTDSLDKIHDIYSNKSPFSRLINERPVEVPDSMASRYGNSINSVNYFVLLPFGLNDAAVNKKYLGEVQLKGQNYYKIQVTFDEAGGGKDFEDVYVYWINTESFKVDYLAYSFLVDGGGMRFREAYNERYVKGIRFVDYKNYKPLEKTVNVIDSDKLFESGQLELVSKIETEKVEVY